MSKRLLLALLCAVVAVDGLAAQAGEVERLRRRVTALEGRRATLLDAIARRDSLDLLAQRPTVVGKAPLFLRVPEWAAPRLESDIVQVVDEATAKYGEAFHRAGAETLAVAYRPIVIPANARMVPLKELDTTDASEKFLAARRSDVGRMASARIDRLVGRTLMSWVGGRLDGRDFEVGRRRSVILLAGAPDGGGDRCLKGEVPACLAALEGDRTSRTTELRASLFRFTMDQAGIDGWQRLGATTMQGRSAEESLSIVAGRSFPVLVAEWGAALRRAPTGGRSQDGRSLLALVWGTLFVLFFGWRLTWHRA